MISVNNSLFPKNDCANSKRDAKVAWKRVMEAAQPFSLKDWPKGTTIICIATMKVDLFFCKGEDLTLDDNSNSRLKGSRYNPVLNL